MFINETVDTVTFQDKDKEVEYTVKREFLEQFKDVTEKPYEMDNFTLFTKYYIPKFLHNPVGAAVKIVKTGDYEYWINAEPLTEEEAKRMENNLSVQTDIKSIVNE